MQCLWRDYGAEWLVPSLHDLREHKRVLLRKASVKDPPPPPRFALLFPCRVAQTACCQRLGFNSCRTSLASCTDSKTTNLSFGEG
jgi:hypothetical protein